jgi:RNA polymerase sigma-70 factor, ECF subfamily
MMNSGADALFFRTARRKAPSAAVSIAGGAKSHARRESRSLQSDAKLVARVRLGDVDAFGLLAERYERSLLALAFAKLRDFHAAEDVVQATLLRAFRRLETLRDDAKFGPWLIQIGQSQVAESARARRIPLTFLPDAASSNVSDGSNPEARIENEQLLTLVARLPDHERVLVGLRYFDGHSMAEIAAISARPIGTVTKQLSRAITRLRAWYEERTHNEP